MGTLLCVARRLMLNNGPSAGILSGQIEWLFRVLQFPLSLAHIVLVLNHGPWDNLPVTNHREK